MTYSFPTSPIIILIFTLPITLFSIPLHTTLFSLCFLFNPFYFSHSIFWHSHILSTFNNESICLYSPTDPPYTTYLPSLLLYRPYFDSTYSPLSLHFPIFSLLSTQSILFLLWYILIPTYPTTLCFFSHHPTTIFFITLLSIF